METIETEPSNKPLPMDYIRVFRMTPALASLLSMLMTSQTVTKEDIEKDGRVATNIRVAMCRLRKELQPYDVIIQSRRFIGYWLSSADKRKVTAAYDKARGA